MVKTGSTHRSVSRSAQTTLILVWLVVLSTLPSSVVHAATPGLTVEQSSSSALTLRYNAQRNGVIQRTIGAHRFTLPDIAGASSTTQWNRNDVALPCVRELVAIPSSNGYHLARVVFFGHEERNAGVPDGSDSIVRGKSLSYSSDNPADAGVISSLVQMSFLGLSMETALAELSIHLVDTLADPASFHLVCDSCHIRVSFSAPSAMIHRADEVQAHVAVLNENMLSTFRSPISASAKANNTQTRTPGTGVQSSVGNGTWVKIAIPSEGLYHIDAGSLANIGVKIPNDQLPSIKIFSNGGRELSETVSDAASNAMKEQPIDVKVKNDGSLGDIVFYAAGTRSFSYDTRLKRIAHYLNHYSETAYYFLTWGGRDGVRMSAVTPPSLDSVVNTPTKCTARVFYESELVNAYNNGSGRRWFGEQLDAIVPRTFTTKLPGLIRNGTINYVIDVAHRTPTTAKVNVQESGTSIASIFLDAVDNSESGFEDYSDDIVGASFDASKISTDATSVLQFNYVTSDNSSVANGLLDFFEIHYPCQLSANNDQLSFVSDENLSGNTQYTISGFGSPSVYAFDVSDHSAPLVLKNVSSTGGIFSFVSAINAGQPRQFFLSARVQSPSLSMASWASLRDTSLNADLIVLCPAELRSSAEAFATYRRAHSHIAVTVVNVEDVYNEFGSGIADPSSIRDFIADAVARWSHKPQYVLLWGDGHYDYKYITTEHKNYVVMWESDDPVGTLGTRRFGTYTDNYSTDDFFACVVGNDDVEDVALGRLPIDSPSAGDWMVEKIRHYEEQSTLDSWRSTATFVADDDPTANGEYDRNGVHTNQSESLTNDSNLVPTDITQRKIYLAEYPAENIPKGRLKPGVTADLISTVNNGGTLLLNWIGHGNPKVWSHETVLSRDITIPQFTNLDKLFFLGSESCDFGRCDLVDAQSGAELMILSKVGGAIGTLAAARVSWSSFNAVMGQEFFRQVFTRGSDGLYRTIGDVVKTVKASRNTSNDKKYYLLCDPTLRLLVPNDIVSIDSVNDAPADSVTSLSALSTVRISGSIRDYSSGNILQDFNGSITLNLFDSDILLRFQDPSGLALGDSTVFQVLKYGGALHRGNYSVANGRFHAEFVLPKDIAYSNKFGRLFTFAVSNDKQTAKGVYRKMQIGGILSSVNEDVDGPDLNVYMDATTFKSGDYVRKDPLLLITMKDATGINATGIGVGHKIEAWIDDNSESIDLTDTYTSSLSNSREGMAVKQIFNLSPGYHSIRARAWDVLNNVSVASTYFYVAASDSVVTSSRIVVYPNPFGDAVRVFFTHNQTYNFRVDARIYATDGRMVRSMSQEISSLQSGSFDWDAKDDQGNSLSEGSYEVVLSFHAPDGSIENKQATIVYLK